MGDGDGGIRAQGNLTLIGVLMEGEFFFVGGEGTSLTSIPSLTSISSISSSASSASHASHASPIPSPIALISLLEEGEVMIDGLQIERAVDV